MYHHWLEGHTCFGRGWHPVWHGCDQYCTWGMFHLGGLSAASWWLHWMGYPKRIIYPMQEQGHPRPVIVSLLDPSVGACGAGEWWHWQWCPWQRGLYSQYFKSYAQRGLPGLRHFLHCWFWWDTMLGNQWCLPFRSGCSLHHQKNRQGAQVVHCGEQQPMWYRSWSILTAIYQLFNHIQCLITLPHQIMIKR